ncbi:Hypothetical predicted protein [Mytilus galloprovincialis]|uniref:Uncharacterized protein n=2 Tax=Mytilus galloprovincialis TaxID=29158 RepID=A0A8B6HRX8_MYTGA|nr:Hypothetical predicted protein [Mytilus galloprovincialis]
MVSVADKEKSVDSLCCSFAFFLVCACMFFVLGGIGAQYFSDDETWDTGKWYQYYIGAFVIAPVALLNALWACIAVTKVRENKQKELDDSIGCIWLLLLLATAAFVVGAVFFGGFSEHSKALQECERNETKALIKTSLEDHCSDATYKAFCICFIVGLVLFGLTTLASCSHRSKENEKLHSRSHQVAPKTAAPKAAIKLENKGNPENDQLKKQNQTLTGEKERLNKQLTETKNQNNSLKDQVTTLQKELTEINNLNLQLQLQLSHAKETPQQLDPGDLYNRERLNQPPPLAYTNIPATAWTVGSPPSAPPPEYSEVQNKY